MTDQTPTPELPRAPYTFHGAYTRAVDVKGRFNLPFRFRQGGPEAGVEKYVVSRGPDGGLTIHPEAVWTESFERMRTAAAGSKELRRNLRIVSRSSRVVEPDSQGRVAVSPELLVTAGISRKVAVVGVGAYMELWDPDALAADDSGDDALDEGFVNEFFR